MIQEMVHSEVAAYDSGRPGPLLGRPAMLASHMSALSQSQLISQMGIRSSIAHSSPSPPGSKSATPSPSSSTQEEDSEAHFKISGEKRPSADPGKKAKNPKKKKKKDPNEPQKPVSAYALFFRDTQAAIKGQNPSATFGDVSKIVASMWDSLGEEQKQAYKRKTEAAKKEYLKALAAYRASLVSKSSPDQGESKGTPSNPPAKMLPPKQPMYAMPGLASFLTPSDLQAFHSGASPASLARTLGSKSLLPGLSASPPPPPSFPLSPPLHQQLPLPPHAQGALLSPPVSMSPAPQPPVLPTPMALQVQLAMSPSPPGPQDFPHISEFPSGSGSRSPGPPSATSSGDWDSSFPSGECGISTCSHDICSSEIMTAPLRGVLVTVKRGVGIECCHTGDIQQQVPVVTPFLTIPTEAVELKGLWEHPRAVADPSAVRGMRGLPDFKDPACMCQGTATWVYSMAPVINGRSESSPGSSTACQPLKSEHQVVQKIQETRCGGGTGHGFLFSDGQN
ncbi:TOX high mobility group box family member 2 [Tupaia chinensis]|uniref:TOX high mobility group box family member 2 n=1 Tax=Tupaia chinensis TaxID=246437 RepID=L9KWA9_TUPCH|nr:TOX high mobility group box family member 2 [Tupaia chinensis]